MLTGCIVYIFSAKNVKNGQEIILVYICQHNSQNKTQKIVQYSKGGGYGLTS